MSIENVNQFYQIVSRNPELQLQFQFATDEENLVNMAVELGQQHGYSFTKEEVIQAIALSQPFIETTGMVELADEQLEAVAGGKASAAEVGKTALSVASWVTPVGFAVSHGIIPLVAGGNAAADARRSGGNVPEAAKRAVIDAHKDPLSAFIHSFKR